MTTDGWASLFTLDNLIFLSRGLLVTISFSILVTGVSLAMALILGIGRHVLRGPSRVLFTIYVDLFRNIPLLVLLFFMRFGAPLVGLNVSAYDAAFIAFILYTSAMLSEVIRGGLESLPRGQGEAAAATGLGFTHTLSHILLPQVLRVTLPGLIGQLIIIIQGTALLYSVGVTELFGSGTVLYNNLNNPMETMLLLAAIYFVLGFGLEILRRMIDRRVSRSIRAAYL